MLVIPFCHTKGMTSNQLTPKQIVDKNGVSTTRNVNPDKGASTVDGRVSKVGAPPVNKPERSPLVKLNMGTASYTVGHWLVSGSEYELNAPYQRGSVWEPERKRNLIRSLMLGVPTGSIIVNIRPYSSDGFHGAIVDGKQRIEAVLDFMEDRLEVPNAWFEEDDVLSDKEMVKFSELSYSFQRGFKYTTVLPVMEAKVPTIEEEAEIFLLINQGGVEQEESTLNNAKRIAEGS